MTGDVRRWLFSPFAFVFRLESDLESRMAVSCMARDSASSALSTFPNVVAGVTSPCMDAGQVFRDRYDVEERQRHETADGERCRQVVIHGGGQVLDDFEEVEDGLD